MSEDQLTQLLDKQAISDVVMTYARAIDRLDEAMLRDLACRHRLLVTVEENSAVGGFGSFVASFLEGEPGDSTPMVRLALPDGFVTHGPREKLLDDTGLSAEKIAARILAETGLQENQG